MASQTLTATSTVVRVNLLPPEIDERRKARRVQAGMAAAAAAAVGVVGMMYVAQSARLDGAKDDLASAEQAETRLRAERTSLNNVSAAYAKLDGAESLLRDAMGQEIKWSGYVNALSLSIPEGVWLERMSVKQTVDGASAGPAAAAGAGGNLLNAGSIGTVTFEGVAFKYEDVAVWLETLTKQKGYANPYFSKAEIPADTLDDPNLRDLVEFESTVAVTKNAYSNRYTAKQARS